MSTQQHLNTLRQIIAKVTAIALLITVFVYMLAPKRAARDPKPEPVGGKNNLHGGQASPTQTFLRSQGTASLSPSQSRATKMLLCRSQEETPSWAIAYGHEFWRHEPTKLSTSSLSPAAGIALRDLPSFDVNDLIERVSHAFSAGVSGATANMRARIYTASFDGAALHFSPFEPDKSRGASEGSPGPGIEARFLTTSVRLGENVLYDSDQSVGVSAVLGNTAQILLEPKSGLVEHFETRSEGVAVSWIISQPSGKDPSSEESAELRPDLVVEAELSGLTYVGRTSRGHHFADADGISRLVFGNARVVDAAGRTWDVPVTVTENRLSLTVPGVILAQSQYPVALDPVIGPEFGVDNPILSPSTIAQVKPAIASNGRTYLVVWATSAGVVENSGAPAIAACRVTQSGVVLDVQGIGIIPRFQTASSQWTMRAASDGSDYLVVWQELRVGGNVITGARVSSEGVLLDTNNILLRQQTSQLSNVSVAGQSNGYLVAWQDDRNGADDIYGARISPAGVLLDANNIPLSRAASPRFSPAVAASGGDFLVVWEDLQLSSNSATSSIHGTRVTGAGEVLDTNGFAISSSTFAQAPAVAAIGPDYFVTWQEHAAGNSVLATRVTHNGLIVDTNNLVLGSGSIPLTTAVAATDGRYLVVWQVRATTNSAFPITIFGNLVTTSGAVLFTNGFSISQPAASEFPAVAGNGTNFFVVWQGLSIPGDSHGNIFGTPVNLSGEVLDPNGIPITPSVANAERAPAVAFDGTNYLAVWSDARNTTFGVTGYDIYGARIAPDGSVLDPNGIPVCTAKNNQFSAAVAASAGMFLAVWVDQRNAVSGTPGDIFAARITDAGTVLDTNGIAICTLPTIQDSPAVAAGSNDFLVVWANQRPILSVYDLFGTRVGANGVVATPNGTAFTTNDAGIGQGLPAVAFNGSEYLVAWSDARDINISGYNILSLRIDKLGVPIDSAPITVCSRPGLQTGPAVASDGTDFLAVWADVFTNSSIYAARVSASGSVLDPNGFRLDAGDNPAVASDGTDYLVIWQVAGDIRGARISSDGSVLDTPSLAIDTNSLSQSLPAIAYGGGEQFLAVNQGTIFSTPRTVGEFVALAMNHPPVAVAHISPLFSILPGDTNLYVLSPDGFSATVLFDASQSYDVDNQPLHYTWYIDGQTSSAGTGILRTNVLPVGLHTLQLVVSDGITTGDVRLTFEIISHAIAAEQLFLLVAETDTITRSQRPLLASLADAMASFEAGNTRAAVNQLTAFENKVEAQVAPSDPALASQYAAAVALLTGPISRK